MRQRPGRRRATRPSLSAALRRRRGAAALLRIAVLPLLAPLLVSPLPTSSRRGAGDVVVLVAPAPDRAERSPAPPAQGRRPERGEVAGQVSTAPGPQAAGTARAPLPARVETVAPDVLVRPAAPVQAERLAALGSLPGVRQVTGVDELQVTVGAPGGPAPVRLLLVEPAAFRPLTPDKTAQTREVWEHLSAGELVVRHDVAKGLHLPLGGTVTLTGPSGVALPVRVGAFASNGSPPLADALLPRDLGAKLGSRGPNLLIVVVKPGSVAEDVGRQVAGVFGGGAVSRVEPPAPQQATLVGPGADLLEPFDYTDTGDGTISIDPAWVERWIVNVDLPILGPARCNEVMVPQLVSALEDVQASGLAHLIDRNDFGGCWQPRHVLWKPELSLSMHAWGLAVDINGSTNAYGAAPTMDPRIVAIFERWGFGWGGQWYEPDGMHFELQTIFQ